MAAAVADFRPAQAAPAKIKRGEREAITLELVRNPDILAETASFPHLVRVGFAAETEDLLANAHRKLVERGLDLVVANDVTAPGSGFGTDTNKVVIVGRHGAQELPLMSKYEVGCHVLDHVARILAEKGEP
jgi:phosphopantothenoylcysteine decarboxylase/phosphopantothenate--cysteine ligase